MNMIDFKTVECEEFMEKVNDTKNETSKKITEICLNELEVWYGKTKLEKLNDVTNFTKDCVRKMVKK